MSRGNEVPDQCQMCGREKPLTFHHLIPKRNHSNKWFKKRFSLEEMRTGGIYVCRKCHNMIHKTFSEKSLGRDFNTLDAILSDERIQKFVAWVKKQR